MKSDHPIAALCAALEVTASGYYAWRGRAPSARAQADAALQADICAIHQAHRRRYGAPRIHAELRARGQRHSRKRVARLMCHAGLRGLCARRFVPRTTDSRHTYPIAPNRLAAHAPPTGPNPIWVADLTYVPTATGWLYVAVIMALYSRRIIGWAAGQSLATATVLAALRMALQHRRPPRGLLYHTDRGVQYASVEHREVLAAVGIEPSMSRVGNPYDNAAMESFTEAAHATADFVDYVERYYNRRRRHSALGYQTPLDFETHVH
ncbi:MAG: IS3 family transposase [Verrucomicrobiae bacterium]|nr:IS3 family transposase [Verrucomicrobiae bacterium]